jgi:ribosomal protein L11 methyltransferase
MYSLRLTCAESEVDALSAELWAAGTAGIRELGSGDWITLIAGFADPCLGPTLLSTLAAYSPEWYEEEPVDWVRETHMAWPARAVGRKLFLAPPWSSSPTPSGRIRLIRNPGLACGTGEHPCTQLALESMEACLVSGDSVVDVGTGSGLLGVAALKLGAGSAIGVDTDPDALTAACENFALNGFHTPLLAAGSADCLCSRIANLTVANISSSVLLLLLEELMRITSPGGWLILTGFPLSEGGALRGYLPRSEAFTREEWCCLRLQVP